MEVLNNIVNMGITAAAAATCDIPPELEQFTQRVSHTIFYNTLVNCAKRHGHTNKNDIMNVFFIKIQEVYGHLFHSDTEEALKKIKERFRGHIKIEKCPACLAIWNLLQ